MMRNVAITSALTVWLAVCASVTSLAEAPKALKFNVAPNAAVSVSNDVGDITVRPGAGPQVTVTSSPSTESAKVEASQSGNRVEIRTRRVNQAGNDPVNYEIVIPSDARVSLRTTQGQIRVENLKADVTAETESGTIAVEGIGSAHVHLRSMTGPMKLNNIRNGHVELTSVSGAVDMVEVTGPYVSANTTDGRITYRGNFGGGGDYSFTSHKGDIDVFLPPTSSKAVAAHSVKGSVENDFSAEANAESASSPSAPSQSTSFSGDSNTGSSSVQLRSFSGKIRIKKQ